MAKMILMMSLRSKLALQSDVVGAVSRIYLPVKGIVNELGSEAGFFELLK